MPGPTIRITTDAVQCAQTAMNNGATVRTNMAPSVVVNASTNASPQQIASEVGWALRNQGRGRTGDTAMSKIGVLLSRDLEVFCIPGVQACAYAYLRSGPNSGTIIGVSRVDRVEAKARNSPKNVRFDDLAKLCEKYFGDPTTTNGGSHRIYKMPWPGDPRVNIQNSNGMAKPYQVRQVIAAIDKLKGGHQ